MDKRPSRPIGIVRAVCTSIAAPSQWDAWDGEGNYYYLRFRHGVGQVVHYSDENWCDRDDPSEAWPPSEDQLIAWFEIEDEDVPLLTLQEFAQHAGLYLIEEVETKGYWQNIRERLLDGFEGDPERQAVVMNLIGDIQDPQ